MTPTEYADCLRLRVAELRNNNKPLAIAATSMTAEMASRIFYRGEKTAGDKMGNYKSYPLYLDDNFIQSLPNISATRKGKNGESKFKNGEEHKTTYFDGWKGVRDEAGRQTAKVDLSFTGDMQSEFTNMRGVFDKPIGTAKPRKLDVNNYYVAWESLESRNKAGGAEKRYGEIFTPSAKEKQKYFYEVAEFELGKLFSDCTK